MVTITFEGLIEKVFYHTIIPPTITGTTIFFLPLTKIILIIEVHTDQSNANIANYPSLPPSPSSSIVTSFPVFV